MLVGVSDVFTHPHSAGKSFSTFLRNLFTFYRNEKGGHGPQQGHGRKTIEHR